jgi:hypothetical protein
MQIRVVILRITVIFVTIDIGMTLAILSILAGYKTIFAGFPSTLSVFAMRRAKMLTRQLDASNANRFVMCIGGVML